MQSERQSERRVVAIVDDDPATRKSIERLLQASGYGTATFACAEAFLESGVGDAAIGLVLDVQLEGMSGLDLLRCLQSSPSTPPVVFITGSDDPATRAEAVALGCIDYLQKPFAAGSLTRAIERCAAVLRTPPRSPGCF
jgi:FixJ family two-component response regulator